MSYDVLCLWKLVGRSNGTDRMRKVIVGISWLQGRWYWNADYDGQSGASFQNSPRRKWQKTFLLERLRQHWKHCWRMLVGNIAVGILQCHKSWVITRQLFYIILRYAQAVNFGLGHWPWSFFSGPMGFELLGRVWMKKNDNLVDMVTCHQHQNETSNSFVLCSWPGSSDLSVGQHGEQPHPWEGAGCHNHGICHGLRHVLRRLRRRRRPLRTCRLPSLDLQWWSIGREVTRRAQLWLGNVRSLLGHC